MKKWIVVFSMSWLAIMTTIWIKWPDQYVKIVVCDVGQGDAILISDGYFQILIDGGANEAVLECLYQEMPIWDRQIDLMIASHADKDHIGGLITVLQGYWVKSVWMNPWSKDTADFKAFVELVLGRNNRVGEVVFPFQGQQWSLTKRVNVKIVSPRVEEVRETLNKQQNTETWLWDVLQLREESGVDHNDRSIAVILQVGQVDFMFTGDIEADREQALVDQGVIIGVEVLKVAHHGAKTSTTEVFLNKARPEISLLSSGKNNNYGHPNSKVLEKLTKIGSKILRTDEQGKIVLLTDGLEVWEKKRK
jgi:competence protein ComEC